MEIIPLVIMTETGGKYVHASNADELLAKFTYEDYVSVGQENMYLMRFNIAAINAGEDALHQYASATNYATNKANILFTDSNGSLINENLTFKIPIYSDH